MWSPVVRGHSKVRRDGASGITNPSRLRQEPPRRITLQGNLMRQCCDRHRPERPVVQVTQSPVKRPKVKCRSATTGKEGRGYVGHPVRGSTDRRGDVSSVDITHGNGVTRTHTVGGRSRRSASIVRLPLKPANGLSAPTALGASKAVAEPGEGCKPSTSPARFQAPHTGVSFTRSRGQN
jgi:hypothetical protein